MTVPSSPAVLVPRIDPESEGALRTFVFAVTCTRSLRANFAEGVGVGVGVGVGAVPRATGFFIQERSWACVTTRASGYAESQLIKSVIACLRATRVAELLS